MDIQKLKAKVGPNEFEAEGPTGVVQAQFEAWKQMIASLPSQKDSISAAGANQQRNENGGMPVPLDRITKADGRVISLTAPAASPEDAVMLIMLGQRHYRNNEIPTGSELMDGLEVSGIRVPRVDRVMEKIIGSGWASKIGTGKATRYRLTNPGIQRAQALAKDAIALVG